MKVNVLAHIFRDVTEVDEQGKPTPKRIEYFAGDVVDLEWDDVSDLIKIGSVEAVVEVAPPAPEPPVVKNKK